jgi:hypothetical protein
MASGGRKRVEMKNLQITERNGKEAKHQLIINKINWKRKSHYWIARWQGEGKEKS